MAGPSPGDWFQIYIWCVKSDGARSTNMYVQLEQLDENQHESESMRQTAHQLRCVAGTTVYLICVISAKYSAMLEPVTQLLHAVDMDMMGVSGHVFQAHRDGADRVLSEDVIPDVKTLSEEFCTDFTYINDE